MKESTNSINYHSINLTVSKSILIRSFVKEDEYNIWNALNNDRVSQFLVSVNYPLPREETKKWIKRVISEYDKEHPKKLHFAIVVNGTCCGAIGLNKLEPEMNSTEIGYSLAKEYHKQGIMTQVIAKIILFAKNTLHLKKITGIVFSNNPGSSRVLEKNNFEKTKNTKELTKEGAKILSYEYVLKL